MNFESKQTPEIYLILYPKMAAKPSFSGYFSLVSRVKRAFTAAVGPAC
jgi:hypothetical protein